MTRSRGAAVGWLPVDRPAHQLDLRIRHRALLPFCWCMAWEGKCFRPEVPGGLEHAKHEYHQHLADVDRRVAL